MPNQTLLPCPFCESSNTKPHVDDGANWVQCMDCGATGPTLHRYSEDAAPDWNSRIKPVTPERDSVIEECAALMDAKGGKMVNTAWVAESLRALKGKAAVGGSSFAESQIVAAGRALANRNADACGVNRKDNWNIYGNDFIEDARAAIAAAIQSAKGEGNV
jgi:hypothetical protein